MPLPVPVLDDLDFERLVEEGRGLIPRYAPAWTDHNIHDPGMTLLDLVAWLVDQQIYQVGFVSDRHIAAFAALLGIRGESAKPARGLIWPREDAIGSSGVNLQAGTRISCIEQPELAFELASAVYISPARLVDAPPEPLPRGVEITARTAERGVAISPVDAAGSLGVVDLVFDRPLVESDPGEAHHPLAIGVALDAYAPPPPVQVRGRLLVDYRSDRPGALWRRLEVIEDGSHALNRSGTILLRVPALGHGDQRTASRLRLRVQRRINPQPPRITRIALNVLPVVQQETRDEAVLGRSNGLPNQSFSLALEGITVAEGGVQLPIQVAGAEGIQTWQGVDDLTEQGPQDAVFQLVPDANAVVFGNGINGRIPPRDAQILHQAYRLTQGSAGNLAARLTWTVAGIPMRGGRRDYGSNPTALDGGTDAWDLDRLRAAARQSAVERRALLTNDDLLDATLGLPGMAVARAEVLVGFHPALPRHRIPGTRTLVVIPARGMEGTSEDVPTHYTTALERLLAPLRVLGERLSVLAAGRISVSVEARLLIHDGSDPESVLAQAQARLNARLSDVKVRQDIPPWQLGRPVTSKEITALLAGVDGVLAVPLCRLARGTGLHRHAHLRLERHEIAIGHGHRLDARTPVPREV